MTFEQYRKKNDLSMREIADKLFVSKQTVWLWEKGRAKPHAGNMVSISNVFHIPLAEVREMFEEGGE